MQELQRRDDANKYTKTLQKQIRDNEVSRINDRKVFFEECIRLDEEARARRAKLDDIIRKKLEELKKPKTPEKFFNRNIYLISIFLDELVYLKNIVLILNEK